MANRRMFSNRIANSQIFLTMPSEAQLLYFHMVMRADDDGIVEAYPVIKVLGSAEDNLKLLMIKGLVKPLNDNLVIVITDWLEHNTIRADRKVNSIYLPLLKEKYPELPVITPKPRKDVKDNTERLKLNEPKKEAGRLVDGPRTVHGQGVDGPRTAEVKLSEVKIEEIPSSDKRSENTENGFATASRMTPITASLPPLPNTAYKKKKPFYRGLEMRQAQGRWWVIPKDGGEWLEYADSEAKIEWREI